MPYNTKNIITDAGQKPIPQYFNETADAFEDLRGRNGAQRIELYGPNGDPISVTSDKLDVRAERSGRRTQVITIANAINITDVNAHDYSLVTHGGLTKEEVRSFKEFKISIADTHTNGTTNATATITLFENIEAAGTIGLDSVIYTAADVLEDGTDRIIFSAKAGGTGASSHYINVPALESVMGDLTIRVQFTNAPTSGALTIKVEAVA